MTRRSKSPLLAALTRIRKLFSPGARTKEPGPSPRQHDKEDSWTTPAQTANTTSTRSFEHALDTGAGSPKTSSSRSPAGKRKTGAKHGKKSKPPRKSSKAPAPPLRTPQPRQKTFELGIPEVKERMNTIAREVTFAPWDAAPAPSDEDRRLINARLSAAQRLIESGELREDGALELVIGFDLGSTSSKIVANFPYAEARGAFAIPAPPPLRASDLGPHPYYWHTRLWEASDNSFALLPSGNATEISRIKVNFLEEAARRGPSQGGPTPTDTHIIAYVALMVRHALGWLAERLGPSFAKNGVRVSSNIGFPADPLSKHDELAHFRSCFDTGLELALSGRRIDKASILETWQSTPTARGMVVPEFIGAVMGYFSSTRGRPGTYFLCDFGGLTCDCVFFRFEDEKFGDRVIRIYGAQVATFGAEVAFELLEQGVSVRSFEKATATFLTSTLGMAYEKIGPHGRVWGGITPLFRIGGGQHLNAYDGVFPQAENLIRNAVFKTSFDHRTLELPEGLDIREARSRPCDRLLLAWGLSHPDLDLPEWVTPVQMEDAPRKRTVQFEYVGQEQV